ncbi:MAG: S8 family serine peptidase [Planctomycetota bacterium]
MIISYSEVEKATGAGVRVLVMDSGVDLEHPDLAGVPITCWRVCADAYGVPTIREDPGGDAYGHGTAVCSILHQYAPGIELHSLRVLDENIRGSSEFVILGFKWAIDEKFDIVNCSFGTGRREYVDRYKRMVDRAFCDNVWLVSACNNQDFKTEEYPAFFPTVLSTCQDDLPPMKVRRNAGELVEFAARGINVKVAWTNKGHKTITGSSFAAPHLAALAARIRELHPDWNACQVKAALYELAKEA